MKWLLLLAALFALPAYAYSGKELRDDCLAAESAFATNAASPNVYQTTQGHAASATSKALSTVTRSATFWPKRWG